MQKYNFDAFSCRHFNFKIVLQSAPEHAIFIQKIDKFSSTPYGASTFGRRLYRILDTPLVRAKSVYFTMSLVGGDS